MFDLSGKTALVTGSTQGIGFEIAKLCAKYEVPLVVSSDAHFASEVGEVAPSVQLLQSAGVPAELVLNADEKRFAERLHAMTGRSFSV